MSAPQQWRVSWLECIRFVVAWWIMRLGRQVYAFGHRHYPHGLRQNLRVYPWLKDRMPWVELMDSPKPKTMSEMLDEHQRAKNVPAYREIDPNMLAAMVFQKWLHRQAIAVEFDPADVVVQERLMLAIKPIFADYRRMRGGK